VNAGEPNAVVKYLRYLATHPERAVQAVLGQNTNHLCWMYEYYATPCPSGGVSKLNIFFTADAATVTVPSEVLGIAEVREFFDISCYPSLTDVAQQQCYLDQFHAGMIRCAAHFGWDQQLFEDARQRMLADGLRFSFFWKKPLASPDRHTKVQGLVEAAARTNVWLVFFDRQMNELHRSRLANMSAGSFDLRHIYGKVAWLDNATVQVTMENGRDYWLCKIDGTTEFHYPPAELGDAHGEFRLGRIYWEGSLVPADRQRALQLLRSAASKGYKHALNFLNRIERNHEETV
jgi:hypothetical protein